MIVKSLKESEAGLVFWIKMRMPPRFVSFKPLPRLDIDLFYAETKDSNSTRSTGIPLPERSHYLIT